jgi:hypothetical protein
MNFFVMVIQSPGYIFGPAMLLAGLIAVYMCVRASRAGAPDRARWVALAAALSPIAIGLLGAVFGALVLWQVGAAAQDWANAWQYLACTVVFGVFVSLIPLVWAGSMRRRAVA